MAIATILQLKRDSAADWTSNNPTLESGRVGIETDTRRFKIGDGATAWTSLAYAGEFFDGLFSEGSAPSTPASGKVVLYAKTDGLLYSKDDAGTETLVSGGSGGSSLVLKNGWRFFDDFLDDAVPDTPWTVYTSGTNSAVIAASTPATNRPGILALKPGVSGSGNGAAAYLGRSSFAFGGGAVTWEASINIGSALSDATDEYDIIAGATNERASISQANGVYFVYDRNVSVNWQCGVAQANSRTLTPTSVAVAANTWVRLKFVVNAAATEVLFYIDDVLVHTESGANIPDSSTNATAAALFTIVRSAGTTYREANVDYIDVQQTFTSAR